MPIASPLASHWPSCQVGAPAPVASETAHADAAPLMLDLDEKRSQRSGSVPATARQSWGTDLQPRTRLLLTATLHWPFSARLAMTFAQLGCEVHVWCPGDHPARMTRAITHCYGGSTLAGTSSLRSAIIKADPDFIVACDDDAASLLTELHASSGTSTEDAWLRKRIAHSLGNPDSCRRASNRAELMQIAKKAGVRIPVSRTIVSTATLQTWATEVGFPAVLKTNGSWGGLGVTTVGTLAEAQQAYRRMLHPSRWHALKQLVLRRDWKPMLDLLPGSPPVVTMQQYIHGQPANRAVACWRGEVLAGLSVISLQSARPTGPATVVQITNHAEMHGAAERMLLMLGMSGFCGLDFIIETGTGAAYLLEMNPRATPTSHLPFAPGHDLPSALLARLRGTTEAAPISPVMERVVALFPAEWHRNPRSPYLREAFHDVPWCEPALIRDGLATPWANRGLIARFRALLDPRRRPPDAAAFPYPFTPDTLLGAEKTEALPNTIDPANRRSGNG